MLNRFMFAAFALALMGMDAPVEYSIEAIRYGVSPGVPVSALVVDGPKDEKVDVDFVVWLIRGSGRNILFDSGFHRERWFKQWTIKDYLRPDEAVQQAGVKPEDITDVVISHAHWDHMGGIDLFPKATVWIQKDEFRYYTGDAWQAGGQHGGIDPGDAERHGQGQRHDGDRKTREDVIAPKFPDLAFAPGSDEFRCKRDPKLPGWRRCHCQMDASARACSTAHAENPAQTTPITRNITARSFSRFTRCFESMGAMRNGSPCVVSPMQLVRTMLDFSACACDSAAAALRAASHSPASILPS
jgi:glyoxylase-like metal-dependent hydrolase (beta-lactamase superfamily II)